MIDKISINGTMYAVTPVPEGEQPSGSTVTVDGVTYLIGTAITAPAEMAQQAIEKIQVNGVLYDIADVEAVEAERIRATEAERTLANNLTETKKDIANQLIVTPVAGNVAITGRNMQSMRINFSSDIPAATTEKAGVMTAEDKVNLANSSVTKVDWGSSSDVNSFTKAGVYSIKGTRTNLGDNLPITNMGENATIAAKLFVTVTPEGATTYRHSIGQTLILTNAEGKETKVYTRNGNRTSTDGGVSYIITWGDWSNLQTNTNVKRVEDLDKLIDNGIYSGVWLRGTDSMTFVCVVINDYALSSSPRRVSQFIYGLNKVSGNVEYLTRIGEGETNIVWGSLKIINEDKISSMISNEIEKVTDGVDPEKLDSLKDLIAWVDTHGGEVAGIKSDIQANEVAIQMESERAIEAEEKLEEKIAKEKTALVNGDTIVGLAREVYSRTGKVDTATFLKRTTAGGTSVSDGVATLKQIGGNIVKNNAGRFYASNTNSTLTNLANGIYKYCKNNSVQTYLMHEVDGFVDNHVYYVWYYNYTNVSNVPRVSLAYSYNTGRLFNLKTTSVNSWELLSKQMKLVKGDIDIRQTSTWWPLGSGDGNAGDYCYFTEPTYIDLTDMFGAGNEPTKEECDRMFACMGALPQGLTVAQPTGLKSIGYNQWNPANVLLNKSIVENAIEDDVADRHIAIVECLPCKTGTGEDNGYVIGYGEGDTWSDEGIEVYLTPLNPLEVDGELYLQKLDKEATYGTYVPQIKGYLLVVTPTTDKLCAHFHWSGDRAATDYEPYVESSVALPVIPEMSEWGLAGIQASGIQDSVNLEKNTYTKRIDCLDLGNINYQYYSPSETYPYGFFAASIKNARFSKINALMCEKYTHGSFAVDKAIMANTTNNYTFYIIDGSYTDAVSLKNALEGVKLYYEIIPQEYPIVTKAAPNYIGSDYGVEEFTGSKVPLVANILFYMRSLVSETRNFLDRLMARLGISDATAVADKIADAILPTTEETDVEPAEVIEE